MSEFAVVVNDCAAVATTGGPVSIRTRDTAHGPRNFLLNYSALAEGLPRLLTDRELDWIETAGSLFAIDLACGRGKGDVEWGRTIIAHLPVRDPEFWSTLAPKLQAIFSDFTSDRLELSFEAAAHPSDPPRQRRTAFADHDCVSLLSGGVDSFVGTTQLVAEDRKPLAVSHNAGGSIGHAQGVVEDSLRARHPTFERVTISAKKYGGTFPQPEPSQRSRSFLFLGAACLVAAVGGSNTVYINENGVMAIHLPMTAARIGSLSTHTASPAVLERIESVAREVLGAPVSILNNLIARTKPEVVELGVAQGVSGDLADTVSCWSIGRTAQHCGVCAPCLMRRISFVRHGVADATYQEDAFLDATVLDKDFSCDNLTHLVSVVNDLRSSTDVALQISYPELLNGSRQLSLSDTIALHRRWADEAAEILFEQPVPASLL